MKRRNPERIRYIEVERVERDERDVREENTILGDAVLIGISVFVFGGLAYLIYTKGSAITQALPNFPTPSAGGSS